MPHFPTTELVSADPLEDICVYRKRTYEVTLINEEGVFNLRHQGVTIGQIVPRSNWSGSLWIRESCIGEYERREGQYLVTPYRGSEKKISEKKIVHPLDYLLEHL